MLAYVWAMLAMVLCVEDDSALTVEERLVTRSTKTAFGGNFATRDTHSRARKYHKSARDRLYTLTPYAAIFTFE